MSCTKVTENHKIHVQRLTQYKKENLLICQVINTIYIKCVTKNDDLIHSYALLDTSVNRTYLT
jgi:hypothetical protein